MGRKFPNLYTDQYEFVEKQIHIPLPLNGLQARLFKLFIAGHAVILRQTFKQCSKTPDTKQWPSGY